MTLGAFRVQLDLDVQRAHRYGRPLALAMIDIDRFRHLNLKRGYAAGDQVLKATGELLARSTRAHDLVCRAGSDEFILMLPETDVVEAEEALDRFLKDLEGVEAGGEHGVAASVGLAMLAPTQQSADVLLAGASGAMELSRAGGGGRVTIADPEGPVAQAGFVTGTQVEIVAALAQALEERDQYTGEHSETVLELTARIAEALAMDADDVRTVRTAALLHDIGKVGIPDRILHKPGPLDEGEWEIMRRHPVIGERILRAVPGMGTIAKIVRHEHERWDGGGYPDRLAGGDIPLGSRIILACDAYHAMISDRPYRKAMSHYQAVAELTANAGTQFDPTVVETLVGYLYGRRQSGLAAV